MTIIQRRIESLMGRRISDKLVWEDVIQTDTSNPEDVIKELIAFANRKDDNDSGYYKGWYRIIIITEEYSAVTEVQLTTELNYVCVPENQEVVQ